MVVSNQRSKTLRSRLRPARWLAFVVAFMCFPGGPEALTDLGHLAMTNDWAHHESPSTPDTYEHQHENEHGCSGLFHTCRCCPTPIALEPRAVVILFAQLAPAPEPIIVRYHDALLDAHTEPPFRPPAG